MREIISQAKAARLRGVKRQAINELVAKGRFTTPIDEDGSEVQGALYLDEVENYKEAKRGRPQKEKDMRFAVGDRVIWLCIPKGGYGYSMHIGGTVTKVGAKKVLLEFPDAEDQNQQAWVNKDDCQILADELPQLGQLPNSPLTVIRDGAWASYE